jgi:hypothetical protein
MLLRIRVIALAALLIPMTALAGDPQLKLPRFEHLQRSAITSVDVTIGNGLLKLASIAIKHEKDAEGRQALEAIQGLKAIYVRSYEFPQDNMYSKEDVESVRAQLSAPGWRPLAQIRQRYDEMEDVDVYVSTENDKINGFAIVATCPRKFAIVNIVGSIDVEKLAAIERRFGLSDYRM